VTAFFLVEEAEGLFHSRIYQVRNSTINITGKEKENVAI